MNHPRILTTFLKCMVIFLGSVTVIINPRPAKAQTEQPVVHAVMFWIDTCSHCSFVREEVLPPLQAKFQEQLKIFQIQIKTATDLDQLYQIAEGFGMAKEDVGVPFIIIGDQVLIGSAQIPDELPGLIEQYLAVGGVGYPDIPLLADVLPPTIPTAVLPDITHLVETSASAEAVLSDRPDGYWLAIVVMAGMVAALLFVAITVLRVAPSLPRFFSAHWMGIALPVLCLFGLGVAGYLAYVETHAVQAMCGPVGDCNAVQSSPYALLFGLLPIGVLGVIGYLIILAAWGYQRLRNGRMADWASIAMFGMALFGVIFSLYLTYLEPFVIKAVCIWCITSAAIMTLLLFVTLKPVLQAIRNLKEANRSHANIEVETPSS